MGDSDSDSDIHFITQNRFTSSYQAEFNSDFERLINTDIETFDVAVPDFDVGKNDILESDEFSGNDTDLVEHSQVEASIPQAIPIPITTHTIDDADSISGNNAGPIPNRFSNPVSEKDLQSLCNSAFSQNTENKSRWALNVFQAWVKERQSRRLRDDVLLNPDIIALSHRETDLNKTLMRFLVEVRNQKGEEYRVNTLYELIASLQYYLRRHDVEINVYESPYFKGMRNVLDARMKSLAKQGIGIEKRQANVVSDDQEDILWEKGMLGEDTPQKLLDTLVYLIGLNCALRAGDEHRNLRVGPNSQFQITEDSSGVTYLKYTEDISKTNKGGLKSRKCSRKTIRVSENVELPQRCPVRLYRKYMSLRPKNGKCNAFYLRPLHYVKEGVWYADIPVGKHPLRATVSKLFKQAGIEGYFTNHSLRATAATRLYDCGLDEQLIAERTGHRSLAIRSYKRTSAQMEDRVDGVIQRKSRASATVTSAASGPAIAPSKTLVSTASAEAKSAETMLTPTAVLDETSTVAVTETTTAESAAKKSMKLVLPDGATLSLSF
ncbi:uncharacterized protein KIAA1958-like [Haliotis rufescens]|uniref:uncharacterized protein KIAA1958-like n=1 Tax=Haliotis rufescens TaxID=6454 RepID=UPI00201F1711|nr:uncharacterized protein KIAA1958-like [Haliotis rufescens]